MKNTEGPVHLYRFRLVGAIGAAFCLVGLINIADLNILPFRLPSSLAIASIIVGAVAIVLEGFLVIRRARRLTRSGAQAQKQRML